MAQPKPDTALLVAGWERDAGTDEYRRPGIDEWMSHDAALFLAHYHEPETPIPPARAVSLAEWEAARASVVSLLAIAQLDLTRVQQALQRIGAILSKDAP